MRSSISLIFVAAAATGLSLVCANPEPTPMAGGMVRRHRHHEIAQRGPIEELNETHLEKRQSYHGSATYYDVQTGNAGACGSYLSESDYVVALAQPLWGNLNVKSPLCGKTITISANGKSTQATIMDACPTGAGNCGGPDLDMSKSLFEFFNPIGVGKFSISWSIGGGGGGGSSHGSSGGNNNNNNNNNDNHDAEEAASSKAAASKSRQAAAAKSSADAEASKSSASLASKSSVSAASVSRTSASLASVSSVSSASVASVASVSSASHYSVTKAAAKSSASVASVASAESRSSKISASKASVSAAKAWASDRARPQNVDNFGKIVNGMSKMVQGAHN